MIIKLLQGCKNLNRKAQREMVNHLSPFLYSVCRRYVDSHEDAKDLIQESLILIFNNMDKCMATSEITFKSWCRRIAINTALAKIRKKKIDNNLLDDSELLYTTLPAVNSQLNVEDILRLLKHLPQNERLTFNLSVIDGYTHQEIAEILQVKESSSRTFLARARQSLQQLIHQQEIN